MKAQPPMKCANNNTSSLHRQRPREKETQNGCCLPTPVTLLLVQHDSILPYLKCSKHQMCISIIQTTVAAYVMHPFHCLFLFRWHYCISKSIVVRIVYMARPTCNQTPPQLPTVTWGKIFTRITVRSPVRIPYAVREPGVQVWGIHKIILTII